MPPYLRLRSVSSGITGQDRQAQSSSKYSEDLEAHGITFIYGCKKAGVTLSENVSQCPFPLSSQST